MKKTTGDGDSDDGCGVVVLVAMVDGEGKTQGSAVDEQDFLLKRRKEPREKREEVCGDVCPKPFLDQRR